MSIVANTLNIQKDENLTLHTSTKKKIGCAHVRIVMARQWIIIGNCGKIITEIVWKVGKQRSDGVTILEVVLIILRAMIPITVYWVIVTLKQDKF